MRRSGLPSSSKAARGSPWRPVGPLPTSSMRGSISIATWAPSSACDRAEQGTHDQEGRDRPHPVARLLVADVDRLARPGRVGVGQARRRYPQPPRGAACRTRTGPAVGMGEQQCCTADAVRLASEPRGVMSLDEVRAVIAAADEHDRAAGLALRLAAVAVLGGPNSQHSGGATSSTGPTSYPTRRSR